MKAGLPRGGPPRRARDGGKPMLEQCIANLGPDLCGLIAALPVPPVRIEQITRQASNLDVRGSFRLDFAAPGPAPGHGRVIKARRFDSATKAAAAAELRHRLAAPFLPRVLAQHGDGMLEQWIEGRVLSAEGVTLEQCGEAGRMLGSLHGSSPKSGRDGLPLNMTGWLERVREHLRLLAEAGVISGERMARIEQAAIGCVPARVTVGVVHRDWCPENLVIDESPGSGRMHCIDNGTLTLGVIEEDLARLRYRWPMSDVQQAAFAVGYGEHRDPACLSERGLFWTIAVLTSAARYRLPNGAEAAEIMARLGQAQ